MEALLAKSIIVEENAEAELHQRERRNVAWYVDRRFAGRIHKQFFRRPSVDFYQFANAISAINNLSAIAAIGCVLPTYFLYLRPPIYRWILSLGIVCSLAMTVAATTTTFFPAPHKYAAFVALFQVLLFSPCVFVLIAILACIKRVTRVGLWSTIVLVCVVADWAGIFGLVLVLQP
jgi:hypothetical protein